MCEVMNIIGDIKGRVLLVDDMMDTAETCSSAMALLRWGQRDICLCHRGPFRPAIERVQNYHKGTGDYRYILSENRSTRQVLSVAPILQRPSTGSEDLLASTLFE